jgi:hypothetical protein
MLTGYSNWFDVANEKGSIEETTGDRLGCRSLNGLLDQGDGQILTLRGFVD